jgi:carbonic anhydrase
MRGRISPVQFQGERSINQPGCGFESYFSSADFTWIASFTPHFCQQSGTCTLDDLTFGLSDRNVQANIPDKGCETPTMMVPGENGLVWRAVQIHVHLGSEHALNGTKYVAEIHVVHEAVGRGDEDEFNELSVLGAFLEVSDSAPTGGFMDGLLRRWEAEAKAVSASCARLGHKVPVIAKGSSNRKLRSRQETKTVFDIYRSLLSKNYSIYKYRGSLTTPPCSELVTWNVIAEPVLVSAADLDRLRDLILRYVRSITCEHASVASRSSQGTPGATSRPLSPLNGRAVIRSCSAA